MRITGFKGAVIFSSGTSVGIIMTVPYSMPRAVSTMTWSL